MTSYDDWKTRNPEDDLPPDPPPPPCEWNYTGRMFDHPRYPSGDCVICGAMCTENCKHENAEEVADP